METRYDDFGRWYKVPCGHWYPSVTSVLSILSRDGIKQWRERVGEEEAERISKHARERGTAMHEVIESFCRGTEIPSSHAEANLLAGQIIPILKSNITSVELIECPLYSDTLRIAGRCDLIANWNGRLTVVDFKNAKKPKKECWIQGYFQQTCCYAVSAWQRHRLKIQQVAILIANDFNEPQLFVRQARDYYEDFKRTRHQFDEELPMDHWSREKCAA